MAITIKIALVSLNQIWENKQANAFLCGQYIEKAKTEDVEVIIFPEMTLTGFSMNINFSSEDVEDSFTIKYFKEAARKNAISIVFGLVLKGTDKPTNNVSWIDEHGNLLALGQKIHPFSFEKENYFFAGGDQLCDLKYKNISFGLTICYDLRFPEVYLYLGRKSDVIINIANWPFKRIDHWNTLLKA